MWASFSIFDSEIVIITIDKIVSLITKLKFNNHYGKQDSGAH